MNKSLAIFGGSTLIFVALAILMGVLPGIWLSNISPLPGMKPLTPVEARGRDIYVAEGCSYCHTQQVRPLAGEEIFGRPSVPGDYAYQTPELLGSERNGPDLSNVGARQSSSVWQYIHLYQPRAVVPQSIMPAFPWLFQVVDKAPAGQSRVPLPPDFAPAHGEVVPTEDGKALVAYILSLKQVPIGQPGAVAGKAPTTAPAGAFPAPFRLSQAIPSSMPPTPLSTSPRCCMASRIRQSAAKATVPRCQPLRSSFRMHRSPTSSITSEPLGATAAP
jgi:hypothetical protein